MMKGILTLLTRIDSGIFEKVEKGQTHAPFHARTLSVRACENYM